MKFGFNLITDEAKESLVREDIYTEQHVSTMIDVVALDNFRVWKVKERDKYLYYYLFKERVYWSVNEPKKDYAVSPPTIHVVATLDVVDKNDNDRMRDKLMSLPEDLDVENGGYMK